SARQWCRCSKRRRPDSAEKFAESTDGGGPRALSHVQGLCDADSAGLIEPENLTGAQLQGRLGIAQLLAIELYAALFDEAPGVSARFCDRESAGVGSGDDRNDIRGLRMKDRQIGICQPFFTEARVPFLESFLSGRA